VRNAYLDPARRHVKGVALLSRLCAATTLDLTVTDSALDGSVLQAIPHLVNAGYVQDLEKSNYRHWKLNHPGIGSLILETLAVDTGSSTADIRQAALLELVRNNPYMVGPVTARIANAAYGHSGFLADWSKLLLSYPSILRDFLSISPKWAEVVDRLLPQHIPWESLCDNLFQVKVLDSLRRQPPQIVVMFLRYAEQYEADAAQDLLSNLVKDPDFRTFLGRQPPHFVVTFLRYAEQYEADAAQDLLGKLVKDPDFRTFLGRQPPQFVVTFLRYAEQYEADAAQDLLSNLLNDSDFRAFFGRQPPEHMPAFLRYAETINEDGARDLLNNTIHDAGFRALLARTSPDKVIAFLWHAKRRYPEASMILLEELIQAGDLRTQLAATSSNFLKWFKK
jgi:hypothetical protein